MPGSVSRVSNVRPRFIGGYTAPLLEAAASEAAPRSPIPQSLNPEPLNYEP
jgi:hypothetical protein